jgi:hypothetical protein
VADDLDTFNPVRGPARERIDAQELSDAAARAAVIFDRRRRQALYFNDRFLTARDLTRGQQYTLLRQADLAQLSGAGVVHGLAVTTNANGTRLHISPGLGIARSGESVSLRAEVAMLVPRLRVMSRQPGTSALVARTPLAAAHTGLFVLTAFPVEHSRNPGLAFPGGTIDPQRADTEIVEGTLFALVPVASVHPKEVTGRGRARLAREVFLGGFDPTAATEGLPLVLLGVLGGRVQWLDRAMVARHVGADAVVGLGLQRRKVRVAFQEQYTEHLADEVERRRNAGLADGLAAAEAFDALPPVGPLPRGAVEVTATEVRQSFFPREIYVEMAIVPDDELPALLAEGLLSAPIDLKLPLEALEGVPVLIVIPVPRAGYDRQTPRMEGAYRGPKVALTGRPLVRVRPIDALSVLRLKNAVPAATDPVPLDLEAWRKAVESAPQLWYVRRQQFSSTSMVVPRTLGGGGGGPAFDLLSDATSRGRVTAAAEVARFNRLFDGAERDVIDRVGALLGTLTGPVAETSVHVSGIMGELAYMARRPRPNDTAAPAGPPRSPVFSDAVATDRLTLRSLQLSDVQRVAARYGTRDVDTSFRAAALRESGVRSVLATSAVVPELASWLLTGSAPEGSPLDHVLSLAQSANVRGLRSLVADVTLLAPVRLSLEGARSFAVVERSGELSSLSAVWNVGHPGFISGLDELLAEKNLGDQPLFASSLLPRLLVLGYELPIEKDDQVESLLRALEADPDGARGFVSPNDNRGKILAAEAHEARDQLMREAREVSPKLVVAAQERLRETEFPSDERGGGQSVLAHRLLGLASADLGHIQRIAEADKRPLEAFVQAALRAVEARSITAMRDAVKALS